MAPVIRELRKSPKQYRLYLCFTGQHSELAEDLMKIYNIQPHYNLNVMTPDQTIAKCFSSVASELEKLILKIRPKLVLVQGDTTSACAATYAAFCSKTRVGHVEAGLRTYDLSNPFPEEGNRVMIDHLADLLFAPSKIAYHNLLSEGIDRKKIVHAGNTVIDALKIFQRKPFANLEKIVVITVHRRESFGKNIVNIFEAVKKIAFHEVSFTFIIPAHPNPNVQKALKIFKGIKNVKIVKPLNHPDFIDLIVRSRLIMTDSGGVTEEASFLRKKLVIVREKTERPEAMRDGRAVMAGTNPDRIVEKTLKLLHSSRGTVKPFRAYGSGSASKVIVKSLKKYLADE